MIEMKELHYFLVCADKCSMSNAATALYTSQPNVSKVIKGLEQKLGYAVFQRDRQGIRLTKKGKVLQKYAIDIINKESKIENLPMQM